ncbi:hypothetical protein ABGN05_27345 [Aquibium sp. LZ166]|uniref:Uncharacterized protein n=1 Tax=Aquibium pacificus TaxID=3153579 RepID=A0ABV3SST5_9HYPH
MRGGRRPAPTADPTDGAGTNHAQVRGDFRKGRRGDWLEGFEPAASLLEPDPEAHGRAVSGERVRMANARVEHALEEVPSEQQASHDPAMRCFDSELLSGGGIAVLVLAIWLACA